MIAIGVYQKGLPRIYTAGPGDVTIGVTLERVQFKFASIIGELCNEPKILSQFAVWLDMRLAEFKLRGSITLDCSGEPTPPGWMQGLEEAIAANRHNKRSRQPDFTDQSIRIADEDDVIVTDETSAHPPHPVSMHSSRSPPVSQERRKVWRKRGDNPAGTLHQDQYHSPPKNLKLSSTTAASADIHNPSYTESLVSIIQVPGSAVEAVPSSVSSVSDRVNLALDGNASGRVETNDCHQGDMSNLSVYFPQSSAASFSGRESNLSAENTLEYNVLTSMSGVLSPSDNTPWRSPTVDTERSSTLPALFSDKRGKYAIYTAKQRADMARYAIQIGVSKASQHFSVLLNKAIRPSTIVSIKQQCLRYMKDNNCSLDDVKELPRSSRYDIQLSRTESSGERSTPQKRERTYWSHEERRAIITNLLPIVQRTRKPPTKSDVYELLEREPVLGTRHWEKVKFQAWSMYQQMMKRQRNNAQNSQDTPAEPYLGDT